MGGWGYVRGRGLCQRRNGGWGASGGTLREKLLICEKPHPDWSELLLGEKETPETKQARRRQKAAIGINESDWVCVCGGGASSGPLLVHFICREHPVEPEERRSYSSIALAILLPRPPAAPPHYLWYFRKTHKHIELHPCCAALVHLCGCSAVGAGGAAVQSAAVREQREE